MTMVSAGGASGRAGSRRWARFRGHFDILALITRGLTRNRRLFNLRSTSAVVSMMAAANCSGGKGRLVGDLAADHSDRANERDPVWVEFFGFGGSVDQGQDVEVAPETRPSPRPSSPRGATDRHHRHHRPLAASTPETSNNGASGTGP